MRRLDSTLVCLAHDGTKRYQERFDLIHRREADGFLPRLPDSAAHLDLLLLTVAKPRRAHPDGIVQGPRCLDLTLAAYVEAWVTIRYDPHDLVEIRVSHDNRFLCRARCLELAGTTSGLQDLIQARDGRWRELRHAINQRADLIEVLLGVHAATPPLPAPEESPPSAPRLKRYVHEG